MATDRLVVDEAARITDHMRVAFVEAEKTRRVEPRIHAGDDRELPARRHRQAAFREIRRVALVGLCDLFDDGHAATSRIALPTKARSYPNGSGLGKQYAGPAMATDFDNLVADLERSYE